MMIRRRNIWLVAMAVALLAVVLWFFRGMIRDRLADAAKPALPPAQVFRPSTSTAAVPTPQPKTARQAVPVSDPLAWNSALPASVNLAVPFLSQAPKSVWDSVHEETCEEASAIMVDAYFHGRTAKFAPDEGDAALLDFVAYEKKTIGYFEDTSASTTAQLIKSYFGYRTVLVRPLTGADDIKRALAHGYPVIVPANGKTLPNPNFRGGGPLYHMLVVKGYTADGHWITNDPGTRLGADFIYTFSGLLNAAHDWNNGDVPNGPPVMLVVVPNT